jgi:hypothetical protein
MKGKSMSSNSTTGLPNTNGKSELFCTSLTVEYFFRNSKNYKILHQQSQNLR